VAAATAHPRRRSPWAARRSIQTGGAGYHRHDRPSRPQERVPVAPRLRVTPARRGLPRRPAAASNPSRARARRRPTLCSGARGARPADRAALAPPHSRQGFPRVAPGARLARSHQRERPCLSAFRGGDRRARGRAPRERPGHLQACPPVPVLHEGKTRLTLMTRLAGKATDETLAAILAVFRRLEDTSGSGCRMRRTSRGSSTRAKPLMGRVRGQGDRGPWQFPSQGQAARGRAENIGTRTNIISAASSASTARLPRPARAASLKERS
jgi:hypothetical protein